MNSSEGAPHPLSSVSARAAVSSMGDGRHGTQGLALPEHFDSLFGDTLSAAQAQNAPAAEESVRLRALCVHDLETGTYNRRHFESLAESEWVRALRHRRALSVMVFEATAADRASDAGACVPTPWVAACAQSTLRAGGDVLARYDRTRFAILLPETDAAGVRFMAERLRRAVEHPFPGAGARILGVNIGAATLKETCAGEKGWRGALDVAEQALERSHQTGDAVVLIEVGAPSTWQAM